MGLPRTLPVEESSSLRFLFDLLFGMSIYAYQSAGSLAVLG